MVVFESFVKVKTFSFSVCFIRILLVISMASLPHYCTVYLGLSKQLALRLITSNPEDAQSFDKDARHACCSSSVFYISQTAAIGTTLLCGLIVTQ